MSKEVTIAASLYFFLKNFCDSVYLFNFINTSFSPLQDDEKLAWGNILKGGLKNYFATSLHLVYLQHSFK